MSVFIMWCRIKNGFVHLTNASELQYLNILHYNITIFNILYYQECQNPWGLLVKIQFKMHYNVKNLIWFEFGGGGVYENYYDILFSASWWQALFSWFKKMIRFWVDGRGVMKVILILEPFDDRRCFDDPVSLHYNLHANQDCVSFPFWQ